MPIDVTLLNQDVAEILLDLPVTVVTQNDSVSGTKGSTRRVDFLAEEGLRERTTFPVFLQISQLTIVPDIDENVTINGVDYQIIAKNIDDAGQLLTLECAEEFTDF